MWKQNVYDFYEQFEYTVADPRTTYVIKATQNVHSEGLALCNSLYIDLVFIISLSYCGDAGFGSDP